jgi:hypothetical protein
MVLSANGRGGAFNTALPTMSRLTNRDNDGLPLIKRQNGSKPVRTNSSILLRKPSLLVSRSVVALVL